MPRVQGRLNRAEKPPGLITGSLRFLPYIPPQKSRDDIRRFQTAGKHRHELILTNTYHFQSGVALGLRRRPPPRLLRGRLPFLMAEQEIVMHGPFRDAIRERDWEPFENVSDT